MQKYGLLEYDVDLVIESYQNNQAAYEEFRIILENYIKELITDLVLKNELDGNEFDIKSRVKTAESLKGKLERKGGKYKEPLKDITDLVGVKVNLTSVIGADKVYEMLTETLSDFQDEMDKKNSENIEKIKRENRQFGYIGRHIVLSYHKDMHKDIETTQKLDGLKAEIQIKTKLQNVWADIEHKTNYKIGEKLDIDKQRDFDRLAAVLEIADNMFKDLIRSAEEINKRAVKEICKLFSDTETKTSINSSDEIKLFLNNPKTRDKFRELESKLVRINSQEISFIPSELLDLINCAGVKDFQALWALIDREDLRAVFLEFTKG